MKPTITIVKAQGRLDAAETRPLETELKAHLDAGRIHLVVDLSAVRYISSVGLRMFLSATRETQRRGGGLALCNLNPRVMDVFRMAGFDRVIQIFATLEEAVRTFPS